MKARREDQLQLLDLQDLDHAIARTKAQLNDLKADRQFASLKAEAGELEEALALFEEQRGAARTELDRVSDESEKLAQRLKSLQARLDSGSGTSKDLVALSEEIEALNVRIADHDEVELEAMQALEDATDQLDAAKSQLEEVRTKGRKRGAQLQEDSQKLVTEGRELSTHRATLAKSLPSDLVELYDSIRAKNGGTGAAKLEGNTSSASGLTIAPTELSAIKALAEDDIAHCPDTDAILVRA